MRRPTPALIVATTALVIATTGTGYALSIPTNSVGAKQLKKNAVTTAKLANSSVTTQKLGAGSVTAAQLANRSVTSAKLAADAVSGDRILDGSIAVADLAAGVVPTLGTVVREATTQWTGAGGTGVTVSQRIACKPGEVVVGGGGWISPQASSTILLWSRPLKDGLLPASNDEVAIGYEAFAKGDTPGANSNVLHVFVICAKT